MPLGARQSFETPINESSRIRLGRELVTALGLQPQQDQIDFLGFFRHPGELVCAARTSQIDGIGTLDAILAQIPTEDEQDEPRLVGQLAPPALLVLQDRFLPFTGRWNKQQNQLHLTIGAEVLGGLAHSRNGKPVVRAVIRNRFLILMSPAHYAQAMQGPPWEPV